MSRSSSSLHGKEASSSRVGLARERVLEGQIRFRKLSFYDALLNKGFCCEGRTLVKLTTLGICGICRAGFAKGECACTLTGTCCYHDPTNCYHCGESVTVGHRGPCL